MPCRPWILLVLLAAMALASRSDNNRLRAEEDLSALEERAIKVAVDRVAPSVVRIETVGGLERVGQVLLGTGPTTGLVVADDGYVISSAFNFVQKPASILVTLADGKRHAAHVVATDHSRMLVLLKVDTDEKLLVPEAVPPGEMRAGAWAIAVGRTFEVSEPNVSVGIVSALGRIWGKAVQTDAKVSPNNYGGPLVDISGRVFGVLVPMSPDAGGEMAGVEWYDSGIGFAVPLADVFRVLPRMREGRDLHPGQMGVGIKGTDLYAPAAVLGSLRATGPAYKAGFRVGDTIVAIAGQPVARPAQMKQVLGSYYAGDSVPVVATRGGEQIERSVELVEKIEPYVFPFLGVLPVRPAAGSKPDGLTIRYVYPDSPAASAGLKAGDLITSADGSAIVGRAALVEKLNARVAGDALKIDARRGNETLSLEIKLATLPESLPGELPAAHVEVEPEAAPAVETGLLKLTVPELAGDCPAYVPPNYDARIPPGVIVWLASKEAGEQAIDRWKGACERHGFLILAPRPAGKDGWRPGDATMVRRYLDEMIKRYSTDPARIVVLGHETGGALAYLTALANPQMFRAVAALDAPLPRVRLPDTDPALPMAVYTTVAPGTSGAAAVESSVKRLREAKFPVSVKDLGPAQRDLDEAELDELARWFDSLDRL